MRRLRVVLLLAASAMRVEAYPHYQLSTGAKRCSSCHYAPAGGGLLNANGRYAAADELSRGRWPWSSEPAPADDARALHGAVSLPRWADVGGDARLALLTNSISGGEREWHVIPMQADLYGRLAAMGLSLQATAGVRPSSRRRGQPPSSHVVSREHYAMWSPGRFYARAGRFMPPYGLRLVDHTAFVRRALGFDLLDESYGASVGWVEDRFDAHATAFLLNPYLAAQRDERGGAATAEVRLGPTAWGGSLRLGRADDQRRLTAGATGKAFVAPLRLTVLGEADVVHQTILGTSGHAASRKQLATYLALVFRPTTGVYLAGAHEVFDEDLAVRDVERQSLGGWISYLPRAHWEILLNGRRQFIGADRATVAFLMLHYSL